MSDDMYDEAFWQSRRERLEREEREWFEDQQQQARDATPLPQESQYGIGLPQSTPEVGLEELVMWAIDHASRVNWSDTFEKFLKKYEVRRRS